MKPQTEKKISSAKIQLGLKHPFIGTLLYSLPLEASDAVPTAGTDGKRVFVNEDFINELSVQQVVFLLAHECLHVAFLHALRLYDRQAQRWNIATDIVINQFLVEDSVGDKIDGGLYDKALYYKGDENADGVYNLLPESPKQQQFDVLLQPENMTDAEIRELEAEMKMKISQAAAVAKAMGKMSQNVARLVGDLLAPKVDWRKILQQFMVKCKDDTRTWSRPNRRFLCQNVYVPSRNGECMGEIAVAVDCSGSVSEADLTRFASEINAIAADTCPEKVHVLYFDSEVCHYDVFDRYEQVTLAPHGGGGTRFSPVFSFMEENGIYPECCVFLTDLYSNDFGDEPSYPVMWVSTGDTEAPFGQVVSMK